jgi:hypothetical protein
MASIDHTVILFKNGEWVEKVDYENLPFEFGRDGNIHTVEVQRNKSLTSDGFCMTWDTDAAMTLIYDDIKWYRYEYDAWYSRKGLDKMTRFNLRQLWQRFLWSTRQVDQRVYETEIGVWSSKDGEHEVYIYHEPMKQSYVSFYWDRTRDDTYIVLGGYGHHANVYAHFMHRGYGKEFERKMAQEAFNWCCEEVLQYIADYISTDIDTQDELRRALQEVFRERYAEQEPGRESWVGSGQGSGIGG